MNTEINKHTKWIKELIIKYEAILLHYVASFLRNSDLAQDVVQECFMRLCKKKPSDLEGREKPWLFTVCRNQAIDILRKEKPMHQLDDSHEHASDSPGPQERAEKNEHLTILLTRVSALPQAQREVVQLKFQSGFSYKEIAEVTERSVGNVGVLLHTALKQLRKDAQSLEAL